MNELLRRRSVFFELRAALCCVVLALLAYHHVAVSPRLWLLGIAFLASNLLILFLPVSWFESPALPYLGFLLDVASLSVLILALSRFNSESLLLYYLTIFLATLSEDVKKSVGVAFATSALYIWLHLSQTGNLLADPEVLVRIPLFFVTALTCGYLAHEVRGYKLQVRKLKVLQQGLEAEIDRSHKGLKESEILRAAAEGSEERFRRLVHDLDAIVWEADAATFHFNFVSHRAEEILGFPVEGWRTIPDFVSRCVHPEDRDLTIDLYKQAVLAGRDHEFEFRVVASDGRVAWLRNIVRVVRDDRGGAMQLRGVMVDATKRKEAELALRESEERHRVVAETATDAIITIDDHSKILFANPAAEKIFGYSIAELIGQELTMLMPEQLRDVHRASLRRYVATGQRGMDWDGIEVPGRHKTGKEICLEVSYGESITNGRRVFTGCLRDVTSRRRAEEALLRLAAIVETSDDAIIGKTLDGTITSWNAGATKLYGYTAGEVVGRSISNLAPPDRPDEIPKLMERLRKGEKIHHYETVTVRKDGTQIQVSLTISPIRDAGGQLIGASTIARDITELKSLELQLRQAQKMEAVGRLAGGVAHDFNNLLTIIMGYSQILLERVDPKDALRGHVKEVLTAADRAASLTRQLLAFSRQQVLAPQILDLNAVITNMEKMLRRLIGEDIELVTILKADLGRVKADPGQVEQVIMNLAVNARDAMPQGGKLTVETANVELDEDYARRHVTVKPGSFVLVAVSDTGCGMDLETQAHIFEPFFTTKEQGRGTGLGLSTVYGIVKQSDGNIWAYSEPGQGTTFKIYLPRVETTGKAAEVKKQPLQVAQGTETVLLVEDEGALRSIVRDVLEENGYQVLEASRGADASSICEQHQGRIHLLLTDVVMPGMSGRELAEQLRPCYPEMRVLYMSGYTDDAIVQHGVLKRGSAFLQKPFTPEALIRKVREVLDGHNGRPS